MIQRSYIDNVRSFVGFEWRPERLALLLGPNGAGQSTLVEVLAALRAFVTGASSVREAFPRSSRTRWDTRTEQTIEVDVKTPWGGCRYQLVIRQDVDGRDEPIVHSELLTGDDGSCVELSGQGLRVAAAGATEVMLATQHTRSGVGALNLAERKDAVGGFARLMSDLWSLRPDARAMSPRTDRRRVTSAPWLEANLANFGAWYPPMLTRKPGSMFKAIEELREAMPGLRELFDDDGVLSARFESAGTTTSFALDELSDGERALIALYTLLHAVAGTGKTLLIDEPDNYLGLREVQPFLSELTERTLRSDGPQVILISHHPEVLNFLAPERGWRMWRERGGPTRIDRFAPSALDPAESQARGEDRP